MVFAFDCGVLDANEGVCTESRDQVERHGRTPTRIGSLSLAFFAVARVTYTLIEILVILVQSSSTP
jgi:hypothetical protein